MISDKYDVVKKIKTTNHASVYLVRHRQLDTIRIAKVISKEVPDYSRLVSEAMLIKDLKYDGLPIIYDIEEDNISICIIEEYIAGKSLEEYIQCAAPLTLSQIVDIAVSVCTIVEYLHESALIAHLDIKPSNIMIQDNSDENGKLAVHLIDFDSSRRRDSKEKSFYGTLGYAAPEQFFGEGSSLSDIYSIGILIAYMVNGGRLQSIMDDIQHVCDLHSKSIGPVIKKCLRHNQSQRYRSIAELKKDLERRERKFNVHNNTAREVDQSRAHIYVSGTRHGIGTTHFCLCMASFLARQGKTVMILRHGDERDLKSDRILKYMNRSKSRCKGIITHCGVIIRPEYSGGINFDGICEENNKHMLFQIHDLGTDNKKHDRGMNILIGDCGYRRGDYDAMDKSDKDTIIFINHISGVGFYQYTRKMSGLHRCYRFPCMYDWDKRNKLFEEAMFEIFGFQKKGFRL